jgi:archaellum component FlaC
VLFRSVGDRLTALEGLKQEISEEVPAYSDAIVQEIEKNIQEYTLQINQLTSERLMIAEKITNLSQYKMVDFWQPAEN